MKPAIRACIAADPRDVTEDTVNAWAAAVLVTLGELSKLCRDVEATGLSPAVLCGWNAEHARAHSMAKSREVYEVRKALRIAKMLADDAWTVARRTRLRGRIETYWKANDAANR